MRQQRTRKPKQKHADARVYEGEHVVEKLQPLNHTQALYKRAIESCTLVVATGPAGVGKTYLPCKHAAALLKQGKIKKIILSRPYAACGRTMGFNSGSLTEKIMPFMLPMLGYLAEVFGHNDLEYKLKTGDIEIVPFEIIRGRSFDDSFIIADECQSATPAEIQALTTRIGENCTLVVMGDHRQNDFKTNQENGIKYLCRILDNYEVRDSAIVEFSVSDIVRSGITRDFVMAYEEDGWH